MNNSGEFTSGSKSDREFNEWSDKLEKMTDMDVSRAVFNRIMEKGDIDRESKEILAESYEYAIKLINQGKNLEPNLLKIYLHDIKGRDTDKLNIALIFLLLSFCGIVFETETPSTNNE